MPIATLKKHPLKFISVILLALVTFAILFIPWNTIAEQKIIALLAQHGFPNAQLRLSHMGADGAVIQDIDIPLSGTRITADTLTLTITPDATTQSWRGTWHIDQLQAKTQGDLIPPVQGGGKIETSSDSILIDGTLNSADKSAHASFDLNITPNTPEKSQFRLNSAALPWNKGMLSVKDCVVLLDGKHDIHIGLNVAHIPVDTLMLMLTGKETPATGDVSGTIPITLKPNGAFVIGKGTLQNEKPGTIALDPTVIPGDHEHVALVREIMKNLHYTLLSIGMDSDRDNKLSVTMNVEGNNPDIEGGRAVKLGVHLSGDLLNLIQQSLMSLVDPHAFIKQHGTP